MLSWPLLFLSLSISSVFDCPTTANYSCLCAHPVYRKGLQRSSHFVFVAILNYKDDSYFSVQYLIQKKNLLEKL